MTIKQLKELITKVEASGVPEDTKVYSQQERCNGTNCFVIARDANTKNVCHVYISDSSPDELEMSLKDDNNDVEIIY